MASLLNMSGRALIDKLPYDAEIEYLESSGTQWIDAEFSGYTTGAEMDIVFSIDSTSDYDYVNGFGNNQGGYSATANAWFYARASKRESLNYCVNYDSTGGSTYISKGAIHHLVARFGGGVLDGVNYTQNGTSARTHNEPFIIFPRSTSPVVVKLWSLKLSISGVLIHDFIPVRVGTTGYLYDKVSKQLFGNAGTGDFILGPDKHLSAGAIDMGLPSGTLWAQGNIIKDANGNYAIGEPTDYGCYFSWGNIDGHNVGDGYNFNSDNYALTPGSQLTGDIPSDDALHDAAVARIGGGYHLPSGDQMNELFNSEYTTNEWTTVNGVNGRRVTSLINGNSVFFPAAGRYTGPSLKYHDSYGHYWLSRRYNGLNAYDLYFNSRDANPQTNNYRYFGFSVRAVHN